MQPDEQDIGQRVHRYGLQPERAAQPGRAASGVALGVGASRRGGGAWRAHSSATSR